MRTRISLHALFAIVAASLLVACNGEPPPTSPTPVTPSAFAGIEVSGPESVATGQSVQFIATLRQSDGTVKSAMGLSNLRWRSSNNLVATVDPSGMVTAASNARNADAVITADLTDQPSVRGTREISVQPEGTYRIVGLVRDAEQQFPITGARVEVLSQSKAVQTDLTGHYRLYGVEPGSTIHITAPGYDALDAPVQITANATRDFGLNLSGPRLSLNGAFTLSVDIFSPCSMDSALQHRTYDATLTTTGPVIDVVLTGPQFRLDSKGKGNRFAGQVRGNVVYFSLDYYWPGVDYPNVAEKLGDGTFLLVQGAGSAAMTSDGLEGFLEGEISHYDVGFPTNNTFPNSGYLSGCEEIQIRLTPRPGGTARRR